MNNPIELLAKACELTQQQVDAAMAVPEAQSGCAEWNATQLVNHLVAAMSMWAGILKGQPPAYDPFNPPHVLGDDMAADFRTASEQLIEAFSADGVMETVFDGPAGEMPGAAMINFPTYDVYVHGWDLEQATGVAGEYPAELTALAMGFAQQGFADERPPHVVGPEVPVGADASDFDKMLGFNGRQP